MGDFREVAKLDQAPEGRGVCVEVEGKRIALFKSGGKLFAIDDECTHAGASLCEGTIDGQEVICPWHDARFDLQSGAATSPPAYDGVAAYPVRVNGDAVEIEI